MAFVGLLVLALTFVSAGASGVFALAGLVFDHDHHHVAAIEAGGSLVLRHLPSTDGEWATSVAHADHTLQAPEHTFIRARGTNASWAAAAPLYTVAVSHLAHSGATVARAQAKDPPPGPPLYIRKQTLLI